MVRLTEKCPKFVELLNALKNILLTPVIHKLLGKNEPAAVPSGLPHLQLLQQNSTVLPHLRKKDEKMK